MSVIKFFKTLSLLSCAAMFFFSCSQIKPDFSPPQTEAFNRASAEADWLYWKGSYASLNKAFTIYEEQQSHTAFKNETLKRLVQTALLLAVRENELSIIGKKYLNKALALIESHPELSDFSSYAAIVLFSSRSGSPLAQRGLGEQYNRKDYTQWTHKNFVELNTSLREKADTDAFEAYFYLTLNTSFPYNIQEEDDFSRFLDIFPDSPLIQYKMALFPKFDNQRMESLLRKDPEFYEAHFFLGEMALNLGNVLTAEKSLLLAYEHIPSSISVLTQLTKIHFLLEEFEQSLLYNEKILALAPQYRDSLLGKAICLGYLGRHEEAVDILKTLIGLGMYLMGESHYWLAWNQHELDQQESAWDNIKRAANYLVGHFEVHSLAGIIAFDMSNIEASEEELKMALWLNKKDCEASFYMGKIFGLRNEWELSGIYFESAALCQSGMEMSLREKIKELESSALSPTRKERHLARKKIQMRKVQVTKATAFYNAAAGYFNAGNSEKALELALNVKDSQTLYPKVEELINKIKEKNTE